eukprot:scaffold4782_cov106-Cylindrotheca_fusiformis.AAC.3
MAEFKEVSGLLLLNDDTCRANAVIYFHQATVAILFTKPISMIIRLGVVNNLWHDRITLVSA